MGHEEGAGERPDRQRGRQQAQPLRANFQNVLRINGQQRGGPAKQDGEQVQSYRAKNNAMIKDKVKTAQ